MLKQAFQALQLPQSYQQGMDLEKLDTWCRQYISQDYIVEGRPAERYQDLYNFVDNYCNIFEPHVAMDWSVAHPALDNFTIYQYAAFCGYDRFIANADPLTTIYINRANKSGMTALHLAAQAGHCMTVDALLARGAEVQCYDTNKKSPIQTALFVPMLHDKNYINRKQQLIRTLMAVTPQLDTLQDNAGNTLLHNLVEVAGFDAIIAEVLYNYPHMALIPNNAGLYPIHAAILNQQTAAATALLAIPGVADLKDGRGRPLSFYRQRNTRDG